MKTVKEVSKECGVSVRTVQYYDKIHLLSPSAKTDAGYRLYSDDDVARLQQILFLKELDFRLKDIQVILNNSRLNNAMTFRKQKELLNAKRQYLDQLITVLEQLEKDDAPGDYARYVESIKKRKSELNLVNKVKKVFVFLIFMGTIVGGVYAFSRFQESSSGTSGMPIESIEANVRINQVDQLSSTLINSEAHEVESSELPAGFVDSIDKLKLPGDIVGVEERDYFSNGSEHMIRYGRQPLRNVIVSFALTKTSSHKHQSANAERTNIYGHDLVIFQCDDVYFTEFSKSDFYFDIETTGLSKREFITLLASFFE